MTDGTRDCKSCTHSQLQLGVQNNGQLRCTVEPPKPFPMPAQGGIAVMTMWPNVAPGDRCGRWQGALFKT